MKPERARELFSDYAEDALTPALRLALDQHFEADPASRAEYEQFARVYALLEAHEPGMVEAPLGFRAKVLEKVAAEQARREAAPAHRAAQTLTGWWRSLGSRRAGAGLIAALAACGILGVVLNSTVGHDQPARIGPVPDFTPAVPTTITGVTYTQDPAGSHYNFQIHLPPSVPSATVNADILTTNDQITDADERAHATPALTPAQTLTNDESMEIPVTLPQPAAAGTTLNMWVQWTPGDGGPTGAQVVFTPAQPTPATPKPLPAATDFFDALQYIAAEYGVTVIADAGSAPTQTITPPKGASVEEQLQSVAGAVGYSVVKLPSGAYEVTQPRQQ